MASVVQQLQAKIRLEAIFKKDIKRIFNSMLKDYAIAVAGTSTVPNAKKFSAVWKAALEAHYRRVQKAFTGVILRSKKQALEQSDDDKKDILALALLMWRDKEVEQQSAYITSTTQSNMADAIQDAREQLVAKGKHPSNRELALAATALLKRRFNGRMESIAITETQSAAESTKYSEAEVESGIKPRAIGGAAVISTTRKSWTTVGDKRVRPIHKAVNGQSRSLTEPFVVKGEYLMYPGDTSLGASYDNVANCRCTAVYNL